MSNRGLTSSIVAVCAPPFVALLAGAKGRVQAVYGRPDPPCSLAQVPPPRSHLTALPHHSVSAHLLCREDLSALHQVPFRPSTSILGQVGWGQSPVGPLASPICTVRRFFQFLPEGLALLQCLCAPAPGVPASSAPWQQLSYTATSLGTVRAHHFVWLCHLHSPRL
ncbi:hypothetical protein NDU88_004914 [Pleurodeles waltl]|uniref:Secreted protein n=1 Tax=Pleurodeles waltl TaxID=8319 RepID=A0AAV7UGL2_PLEWA|nr:hypothetical protein NDU88_004914 [Pleurodeles waltl]